MNNTDDKVEGVWYWGDDDKPYCKRKLLITCILSCVEKVVLVTWSLY